MVKPDDRQDPRHPRHRELMLPCCAQGLHDAAKEKEIACFGVNVCPACGSARLEVQSWSDPNTGEFLSWEECGSVYCAACGDAGRDGDQGRRVGYHIARADQPEPNCCNFHATGGSLGTSCGGDAGHSKDSDCTVDPNTDLCAVCGVDHSGPPCLDCGGIGFHKDDCPQVEALP